jgi:hypothetical protein
MPSGILFENCVIADLLKTQMHRGEEPTLYRWRTAAGSEVDLIYGNASPFDSDGN